MASLRVGVQLIVFGERAESDLRGVLGEVQAAGYDGFEGGGVVSQAEMERVRDAMEGRSLRFVGGHYGAEQMGNPDEVERYAGFVKELGGAYLMVSGRPESLEGYARVAETLNRAGARTRPAGLTLCYHNHAWELEKTGDESGLGVLLRETDPDLVKLCPDICWLHVGGESPAEFLRRHGDRCPCLHFKDGLAGDQGWEFRELGEGKVEVAAALEAAREIEPEWIIAEQDTTRRSPADSIRRSREYLRRLGL